MVLLRQSDSACFDNALELLVMGGYSLAQAMMLLIPEAWQNAGLMDLNKKAFYQFYTLFSEPWDGPAAVAFSDGKQIGLLESKKVYLVVTSGGTRIGSKEDFLTPWLTHVLNFFGLKNIQTISADQMSIDYEKSIKEAEIQISKVSN